MLRHITPEPSSVDGYLQDLRHELAGQVPEHKLDEIIAETESHLRERADAFQELGLGEPEAEAVRTFLGASSYATEMSQSAASDRLAERARKVQRWVVTCLPFAGATSLGIVSFDSLLPVVAMLVLPVLLAVVAGLALVSRRPQTQCILVAGALSAALACAYFGYTWVESEVFTGPRVQAQLESVNWTNAANSRWQRMREIDVGRWVFAQNNPIVPPAYRLRPNLYLIPPVSLFADQQSTTASFPEAKRAWAERGGAWFTWVRSSFRHYNDLAQRYRGTAEGLPFQSGTAGRASTNSFVLTLLILLADRLGARLGEALFWRRRNRKRPKLGSA